MVRAASSRALPEDVIAKIISYLDNDDESFKSAIRAFPSVFPNLNNFLVDGDFGIDTSRKFSHHNTNAVFGAKIKLFDLCYFELRMLDFHPVQVFRDIDEWINCPDLRVAVRLVMGLHSASPRSLLRSKTLDELYVSKCSLTVEGVRCMADVVKHATGLKLIQFSICQIGEEGVVALAEALACGKQTLKELDFWFSEINGIGTKALAESLTKGNINLVKLRIDINDITDEGALALARSLKESRCLKILKLTCCRIGDDGATALAKELHGSNVEVLNLSDNEIGDKGASALGEALKTGFINLKSLILKVNHIANEGAKSFADSYVLRESGLLLDLSSNRIRLDKALDLVKAFLIRRPELNEGSLLHNPIGRLHNPIGRDECLSLLKVSALAQDFKLFVP